MGVVDFSALGVLRLVERLFLYQVVKFLVAELADGKPLRGLMGLTAFDRAVAGVEGGLKAILELPQYVLEVVRFPIAKLLLPVLAERGKHGGRLLVLAVEPPSLRA